MAFLEKFIAAFIIVAAMALVASVGSCVLIGVAIGWAWVIHQLPIWGQWTFNIFGCFTILALIIAAVETGHES